MRVSRQPGNCILIRVVETRGVGTLTRLTAGTGPAPIAGSSSSSPSPACMHPCQRAPMGMVRHSQGVCGTSYFAPHVLRPSIAFTMDFSVGDKVLYPRLDGVCVLATMVGFAPEGSIHLEYFQDAVKVVNWHCKVESISFAIPSADSPPQCTHSSSPPLEERGTEIDVPE